MIINIFLFSSISNAHAFLEVGGDGAIFFVCFVVYFLSFLFGVSVLLQNRDRPVEKTGSDSSTAKRSAIRASLTGPQRRQLNTDAPCHRRFGTLKTLNAKRP